METIKIELDVTRRLRFDVNALAEFDDVNKVSFFELPNSMVSFSTIRNLLWAGLLHEAPEITTKQVGDLIQTFWIDRGKTIEDLVGLITTTSNKDLSTGSKVTKKKAVQKKKRSTRLKNS